MPTVLENARMKWLSDKRHWQATSRIEMLLLKSRCMIWVASLTCQGASVGLASGLTCTLFRRFRPRSGGAGDGRGSDCRARSATSDRKSVVTGKGGAVRVDLGGRRRLKTKNQSAGHA